MPTDSFRLVVRLPATPDAVYEAWIDADQHAAMTGGDATSDPRVGGEFTAWDGYITGTHLELVPGRRIVQSWRTSEFEDHHEDSRLELHLAPAEGGTELVLDHSRIPEGQGAAYEQGWEDHYFAPMRTHFSGLLRR